MSANLGTATAYIDIDNRGFVTGLQNAKLEAENAGRDITKGLGDKLTGAGQALQNTGKAMTVGLTIPIVGAGAAIVNLSKGFEEAMSQIEATMGITKDSVSELNGETVNTLDSLNDLAQQMGRETKFSAAEAADAINLLAMAGMDTQEIYDVLPSTLDLAAAGGLGIAEAADIATGILAGFGMEGDRAAEVSDKLAMLASSAKGDVSEFGEAMATSAGMASVANQSIDDVAVALGILGNNNLSAAEGGNALNRVMKNLYQPTDAAAKALTDLGVSAYDADGNARALPDVLQDLQNNLDGLTEQEYNQVLAEIFDSATLKSVPFLIDGVTDAWDMQGESADALVHKIKGAEDAYDGIGAAAGQAAAQQDNLGGQLTILQSSLEGLALQFGEILLPYVKQVVEWVQNLVTKFSETDEKTKKVVAVVAAFAAALGPVLLAVGTLAKVLGGAITQIGTLGTTIGKIKGAFSGLGAVLTGPFAPLIAILAVVGAAFVTLWKTNEEFRDKVTAIWNQVKETFQELVGGIAERIQALVGLFQEGTGALSELWTSFTELLAPLIEFALETIADLFQWVTDLILNTLDIFIGIFTGDWEMVWEAVVNMFESTWDFITSLFSNAWEAIKSIFTTMKDGIANIVSNIWEGIKTWGQNMWNSAKEMASNFLNSVVEFFSDLPYKAGFWIGETLVRVVQWGSDMKNKAVETAKDFVESLINFIKELPGKIWEWLVKGTQKVTEWGPKLRDGGKRGINRLINGIVSAAASLPGKMVEIGSAVVQGVWNGIKGAIGWFTSSVRGFFSGIVSGAKSALGIASPSRVLADEVGKHIPSGIAQGFKEHLPGAIKDIDDELNKGVKGIDADAVDLGVEVQSVGEMFVEAFGELEDFWSTFTDKSVKAVRMITTEIRILASELSSVGHPRLAIAYGEQGRSSQSAGSRQTPVGGGSGNIILEHTTNLDGREIARETVTYTAEELQTLLEKKRRGF